MGKQNVAAEEPFIMPRGFARGCGGGDEKAEKLSSSSLASHNCKNCTLTKGLVKKEKEAKSRECTERQIPEVVFRVSGNKKRNWEGHALVRQRFLLRGKRVAEGEEVKRRTSWNRATAFGSNDLRKKECTAK